MNSAYIRGCAGLACLLAAGCGGSSVGVAGSASPSSSVTSSSTSPSSTAAPDTAAPSTPATNGPPMVHEVFTPLPCDPNTTVGMEGCAEHRILRADALVDKRVQRLWDEMTADLQADLAAAASAWQDYRDATCRSESDALAGGTLAPVIDARCSVRLTIQRALELRRQLRLFAGD